LTKPRWFAGSWCIAAKLPNQAILVLNIGYCYQQISAVEHGATRCRSDKRELARREGSLRTERRCGEIRCLDGWPRKRDSQSMGCLARLEPCWSNGSATIARSAELGLAQWLFSERSRCRPGWELWEGTIGRVKASAAMPYNRGIADSGVLCVLFRSGPSPAKPRKQGLIRWWASADIRWGGCCPLHARV